MSLTNTPAKYRKTQVFAKIQSALGTFAMPAATDALRVRTIPHPGQDGMFTPIDEIANTRSMSARTFDGLAAGSFDLQAYARPSGAAGTEPEEDVLMYAAFGDKTVNAGTSVVYSLAVDKPYFSMIVQEDHSTWYCYDCKVGAFQLMMARRGPVGLTFGCQVLKAAMAGKGETVAGSASATVNLDSGHALRFVAGAYVKLGSDDNTGAGYLISAVDTSADTLTVSPAPGTPPAAGVTVEGFVPSQTLGGYVVNGSSGGLSFDSAALTITGVDLSINDSLTPDQDELTGDDYPSGLDEGQRQVSGSIAARYRLENAKFFSLARTQTQKAVQVTAGSVSGKMLQLDLGQVEVSTPAINPDQPNLNMSIPLVGFPTVANEDEISFTYL